MKNSAEFERDWRASHLPVFDVAMVLRRIGLELRIPVPMLREDEAEVDVDDAKQGRICRTYACPKALAIFLKL